MKIPVYFLFLVAAALLISCQGEHQQKQETVELPPLEVQVFTVTPQESQLQSEVVGTIQSVNQAIIAAKVTGTIEKMPVVLGSHVQTGDLLAKISAGEISAKVKQAEAQLEQAKRNLDRERKLLQKNAATAENVKSLEEIFRVAEAAHSEAQSMLSYMTITAPFDGVVTKKMANAGDLATPGTPLLQIEDSRMLQVVASVPEVLVLQIETGDTLRLNIPAAGLDLHGSVSEIAPAADPLSRTATVKINIGEAPQLRLGQFARVLIPGKKSETLFVPSSAVHRFGQMEILFVIQENRAHLRLVRTGAIVDGMIEILTGLEPGEIIAIKNSSKLIDRQPVKIVQ